MSAPLPKIGLYQPYPHTLGGLQRVVMDLTRTLPAQGYQPLVICPEAGKFTELLRQEKLPYLVCDPGPAWHDYGHGARWLTYLTSPGRVWALIRYWRTLSEALREQGISLLHCNEYRGVLLAAPAARRAGIPVIWHMHGLMRSRLANLFTAALVECTVPVSQGVLEHLRFPPRWLGRWEVIHNGAAPLSQAATPPPPADAPIVLAVGRLHPVKGFPTLLRAFKQVSVRVPDAECWIVGGVCGDGRHAQVLHAQARQLGLETKVSFLGHAADIRPYLRRCRVVVVPSQFETFGMVAVEAMLAGKPVVACRTGGLKDIVAHRETGALVEPGNAEAMAIALIEILHNAPLAQRMGQAGRARAMQHFTLERMASAFADFYRRWLAQPTAHNLSPA